MSRSDDFEIRDLVVLIVGVILGGFLHWGYRSFDDNKTIARLEAERDSLRGELVRRGIPVDFGKGDKLVLWEEPRLKVLNSFTPSGQIKTEWFWGDSLIETQWKSIEWPPDTNLHEPLKKEKK